MRKTKEEYEGIINTEPVEIEHVCWFTRRNNLNSAIICLEEVVKTTYKHPSAPDVATYYQEEVRFIKEAHELSEEAGILLLMEANQKAITNQMRNMFGK